LLIPRRRCPNEAAILADPPKLAVLRTRLASISWFMAELCEPMARRAHAEDHCRGEILGGEIPIATNRR
jgi:hypothetical protein